MMGRTPRASTRGWEAAMLGTERAIRPGSRILGLIVGAAVLSASIWPAKAQAPAVASGASVLRLEDLERMALAKNPTLSQAQASIRAADGRQIQAGLYPNPLVGY